MDPGTIKLFETFGIPAGFCVLLWILHRDQLRASREDATKERAENSLNMQKERDANAASAKDERDRNDAILTRFWSKLDRLVETVELAKCRYYGPCDFKTPKRTALPEEGDNREHPLG